MTSSTRPRSAARPRTRTTSLGEDQLRGHPGAPGPADASWPCREAARVPGIYGPADHRLSRADVLTTDVSAQVDVEVQRQQDRGRGRPRLAPRRVQLDGARSDGANSATTCRSRSCSTATSTEWGPGFGESDRSEQLPAAARTGDRTTSDPYPLITNCPMAVAAVRHRRPGHADPRHRAAPQRQDRAHPAHQGGRQPRDQGRHRRRGQPADKARLYSGNAASYGGVFIQNDVSGGVGVPRPLGPADEHGQHRPALRPDLPHAEPERRRSARSAAPRSTSSATTSAARSARRARRSAATRSTGPRTCATRGRSGRT